MNTTTLIIILIISLIIIYNFPEKETRNQIDNFELSNIDRFDNIIILVYDEQFYYLNIKNIESNIYTVYRIPLELIDTL